MNTNIPVNTYKNTNSDRNTHTLTYDANTRFLPLSRTTCICLSLAPFAGIPSRTG
ncbi:hypothetical protein LZ30DRAFT_701354 [Colletotrichum cereale]|nr:hypothetical protein LZ30DRAFT_701354 [Colletotrichum cereale]